MKYIISEEQYNKITKTLNESKITQSDVQNLESILNRRLPKNFPFFKKVEIREIDSRGFDNSLYLIGVCYLDFNWILDYWIKFFHDRGTPIERSKLGEILPNLYSIDELIREDDMKRFEDEILKYFNFVMGTSIKRINLRELIPKLVKDESKKMEQMESELTEKCWAGYTQKGMKTMFGKRYPNCVKKTKK